MRQAIVTKYMGPTNYRGARIKATAAAGSMTVNWDYRFEPDTNHSIAALAFARKFGWPETYIGGQMADGRYCFVQCPGSEE